MPPLSDLTTENDSDGYGYVFGIGFVLGMFFSVFVTWMKKNLEFAKRPSIVSKNQKLDTYEMIDQRPMPLHVAILFKMLYVDQIFGRDRGCMTRIIQVLVTFLFNRYRVRCSTDTIKAFALHNGIIDCHGRHMAWKRELEEYESVDDFFTRQPAVSPNLRVLRENILVSPCEGTVVAFDSISRAQRFWIKQKPFSLSKMGIPTEVQDKLINGNILIFKLDVYDIHHFYAPVGGIVKQRIDFTEPVRHSSSVRPFAMQAGWEILTGNRRVLLVIESEKFGLLCMLIVGGIGIDSIEMNVEEGDNIVIGSDVGCFHMGGSAIVLLTPQYFPQIPDVFTAGYNHKIKIRNDIICSSICQFEFKIGLWENLLETKI